MSQNTITVKKAQQLHRKYGVTWLINDGQCAEKTPVKLGKASESKKKYN